MEEVHYHLMGKVMWTSANYFQDAHFWEESLLTNGMPPSSSLIKEYDHLQSEILSNKGTSDSSMTVQAAQEIPHQPLSAEILQNSKKPLAEKHHACDVCKKKFRSPSHLVAHIRVHSGDKPFKCTQCGKSFAHKSNLQRHLNVHTGTKKLFSCTRCSYRCSQQSSLTIHLRTHTGEKPFTCSTCGKSFTQNSNLKTHLLTHTKEKPHKCESCGKCFALKGHLSKHTRTHTGEKPYNFSSWSHRRYHNRCASTTTVKKDS